MTNQVAPISELPVPTTCIETPDTDGETPVKNLETPTNNPEVPAVIRQRSVATSEIPTSNSKTSAGHSETLSKPIKPHPSSPFLDLLKTYVASKCCYHSIALTSAQIINVRKGRVAYQIDLWTLRESRWLKKREKPYNGEPAPNKPLLNAWVYQVPPPSTDLKKKQKETRDLSDTFCKSTCPGCNGAGRYRCRSCGGNAGKRCYSCMKTDGDPFYHDICRKCNGTGIIRCSNCNSTGIADCSRCNTRGQLLQWYELRLEWYGIHSVSYQSNTPLPPKLICKAPNKESYWSVDQAWSNSNVFDNYFQSTFAKQITEYPVKLDEITKEFNNKHARKLKSNSQIVKLKCEIQKLNITEVEYEAEGYVNKRNENMGKSLNDISL